MQKRESNWATGQKCEALVLDYFIKNKYSLICRNYRWKRGEIDLILLDPSTCLVFVEVRAKLKSEGEFLLKHSIGKRKQFFLKRSIEYFLRDEKLKPKWIRSKGIRLDVAWVVVDKIEHWKNIDLGF